LKRGAELSEGVQAALVGMLYGQMATLVAGTGALFVAAALCWLWTGEMWFVIWASLMLVALGGRVALELAYSRQLASGRRGMAIPAHGWRDAFIAGAWSTGFLWGGAALTICWHEAPPVQILMIAVAMVVMMGAAARNASCPMAARGQTAFGLAPLFVACILMHDPYYRALSAFVVFGLLVALKLIHELYDRAVRFLIMNEENVALVREVRQANAELAAVNSRLEQAAATDSLTAIANRRRFDSALAEEVRRAQRERSDLALLLLDIDSFKSFNDTYGHQAGDRCLQRVAATLAAEFRRPGDLVARYGGEEFAVILPQTDCGSASALAESVRRAVEGLAEHSAASPAGVVSVSIGVASFVPDRYRRPEDFIRSADEALYAAKDAGRNCVRVGRHAFAAPEVEASP
jgi:diguanylate cyclase (GGDEF)-like protein